VSWIRLTIGSELKDAILVGQAVHAICQQLNVDKELIYGIELCVVESLTNVIRHAYQLRRGNEVTVTLSITDGKVEVEVADSGIPMPPATVEALRNGSQVLQFDEKDIHNVPERGMGLQIIHETMDEVRYAADGKTNLLYMVKYLPRSSNPNVTA
jgi:anti-sigma regulatory factor (Ser/Thr protein kinase)